MMKKRITLLLCCLLILSFTMTALSSCVGGSSENPESSSAETPELSTDALTIEEQPKFGGVYLHISIEDFLALGFEYGDSVTVTFDNGKSLADIPFYSGYYTRNDEPLLVAYPGYPYICLSLNGGDSAYKVCELTESSTGIVTLSKHAEYKSVQDIMMMIYENDREKFASDESFANFREMEAGEIGDDLFYRAASPCDNQYNRAAYVAELCQTANIGFILDLTDDQTELDEYYNDDQPDHVFWRTLYESGKIIPLNMGANYRDKVYAEQVAEALRCVIKEEGPFLIHCTEGKDRTGFVCLLIEALAGASYDELETDYMKTYENYYGITKENTPESYQAVVDIKLCDMLEFLCKTNEKSKWTVMSIQTGVENYLRDGGMSEEEIKQIRSKLRRKKVTA